MKEKLLIITLTNIKIKKSVNIMQKSILTGKVINVAFRLRNCFKVFNLYILL